MRTNLKVFRVRNHLTQTQMAASIGNGYKRQTYAAIENGMVQGRMEFWDALRKSFRLSYEEVWRLMLDD